MLISYIVWTACSAVNDQTGSTSAGIVVIVCLFTFFFHYDIGKSKTRSCDRDSLTREQRTRRC